MPKKSVSKSVQGRRNRAAGARFELKVRGDLESQGWVVDKWTNNVDLEIMKVVKAKRKFNPYMKILGIGTGFPDFVAIKRSGKKYDVIGIEVKRNGWLDKNEKEKARFLVEKRIFGKILIAKKGARRGEIEYVDFAKKYGKA